MAIQYPGSERNDDECTEEEDLKILEEAASILQGASEEEKAELIKVSKSMGLDDWASQIGIE